MDLKATKWPDLRIRHERRNQRGIQRCTSDLFAGTSEHHLHAFSKNAPCSGSRFDMVISGSSCSYRVTFGSAGSLSCLADTKQWRDLRGRRIARIRDCMIITARQQAITGHNVYRTENSNVFVLEHAVPFFDPPGPPRPNA